MIRSLLCFLILCITPITFAQESAQATLPLIPRPVSLEVGEESFRITPKTIWRTSSPEQRFLLRSFAAKLGKALQWGGAPSMEYLPGKKERKGETVDVYTDASLANEAYRLQVSSERITIHTNSRGGLIYALQTLQRCMPETIDSLLFAGGTLKAKGKEKHTVSIGAMQIVDSPRFGWRGFMLDVSRCFVPKAEIFRLLDLLAYHKINKFHWHLTDDQGWRLEIKRYPLLVETGAWRVDREGYFPARTNALSTEVATQGGYYSQRDVREIVAYAAERNIEVIPEIEMPAHALAALAAYPHLACSTAPKPLTVAPGSGGNLSEVLFCAGNDEVFYFLQAVLTEVASLFPSPYIHIGGNDVALTHWRSCPRCQSRMRKELLNSTDDLRGYFMERIASYLMRKKKIAIGWDHLTDAKLPESSVIMGSTGKGEEGIRAGFMGYPFVQTPTTPLFLNQYQGPQWFEPRTFMGNNTLYDIFLYEPLPPSVSSITAKNLLGIQASLPTEFVADRTDIDYLLFPRLAALAERAWSPSDTSRTAWHDFLQRLNLLSTRYRAMGITMGTSLNNLSHLIEASPDTVRVTLSTLRSDAEIRYTTNGAEPTEASTLYEGRIILTRPETGTPETELRANTFLKDSAAGSELVLPFNWHAALGSRVLSTTPEGGTPQLLVNGLRGSDRHTDGEWVWWKGNDATIELTLPKETSFNKVAVGTLIWNGASVHLPSTIRVLISSNGESYTKIGELIIPADKSFENQLSLVTLTVPTPGAVGRFLRLELQNPGTCPENHPHSGNPSMICIDEIIPFEDYPVASH